MEVSVSGSTIPFGLLYAASATSKCTYWIVEPQKS